MVYISHFFRTIYNNLSPRTVQRTSPKTQFHIFCVSISDAFSESTRRNNPPLRHEDIPVPGADPSPQTVAVASGSGVRPSGQFTPANQQNPMPFSTAMLSLPPPTVSKSTTSIHTSQNDSSRMYSQGPHPHQSSETASPSNNLPETELRSPCIGNNKGALARSALNEAEPISDSKILQENPITIQSRELLFSDPGKRTLGMASASGSFNITQSPLQYGWNSLQTSSSNTISPLMSQIQSLQEEHDALARQLQSLREARTCQICFDKESNAVFMPCAHFMTCVGCASQMTSCPHCRTSIHYIHRVRRDWLVSKGYLFYLLTISFILNNFMKAHVSSNLPPQHFLSNPGPSTGTTLYVSWESPVTRLCHLRRHPKRGFLDASNKFRCGYLDILKCEAKYIYLINIHKFCYWQNTRRLIWFKGATDLLFKLG